MSAPAAAVTRLDAATSERQQAAVAGSLRAAGLGAGDRVAFVLGSSAPLLSAVIGCLRAAVVPVMINPGLTGPERRLLLDDADPALVVDDQGGLARLLRGPAGSLAAHPLARPMHYTSGTTGRPKGVWSGVLDAEESRLLFDDEADLWGLGPDDVLLLCSPMHHSAPLRFGAGVLLRGGSVVVVDRFEAAAVVDAVNTHRPTAAFMVPTHLRRLTAGEPGDAPIDRADLSSFRLLAHAGEACPVDLKERALELFPEGSVWEFYGSTEGQFTVCPPDEWRLRPGTVGRARPGRRLVTDEDGVIWCAPPSYARFSYWRDPARTAAAWRELEDGSAAFSVGDMGRLDPDGYLFIDGRRDDLVISGGVNVYPAEVEAVLGAVPGVLEVAVFGVPDPRWGQRVCAAFVGDADPELLRLRAAESLAAYKRPKDVFAVDQLPKTGTGKLLRRRVAAELGLD
ncbi:MAG TPA: AMP-binding protein [Acidimicrobiales bacterium]|nr:AMP-binding protein [Acidimicrobiales bacterium]